MATVTAHFRFYAELNDFLPRNIRGRLSEHQFDETTTVKHAIESLGVPHTEIDLILINGSPAEFSQRLQSGDHVSVYPVFENFEIQSVTRLRPKPLREPRFILDTHLGRLTAYLRLLGFDCLYDNQGEDALLAEISASQHRILLTRDRGLLKRVVVTHGYCVRSDTPRQQAREIMARFDLYSRIAPFTRCTHCNSVLQRVSKAQIEAALPPRTRIYYDDFKQCPRCLRVYWKGSHFRKLTVWIEDLLTAAAPQKELGTVE